MSALLEFDDDHYDTAEDDDAMLHHDDLDSAMVTADFLPQNQVEGTPLLNDDSSSDDDLPPFLRAHSTSDGTQSAPAQLNPMPSDLYFTVEQAVEHLGLGRFQLKVIAICGLFSMTDALEMLLLAVLAPIVRCDWLLPHGQVAFITTAVFLGMFVGSSTWGKWADQYGRKPILMTTACWICYMGILTAFSPNYPWIVLLRSLVGMGFGGAVQSFTLMSEYLPSKSRAKILILYNSMWALGSCFEMWLAYITIPTLGWRWLVGLSALPMLVTILCIKVLPESARYLVAADRKFDAMVVLHNAARQNKRSLPTGTLIPSKLAPRGRVRDLLFSSYRRTSLQLWVMWFGTAFSYYGIVLLSSEPRLLNYPKTCHSHADMDILETQETCHCELLTRSDYVTMIIATFGEFCGE